MDVQTTPPRRVTFQTPPKHHVYQTPPKHHVYQTPPKKTHHRTPHQAAADFSTPPRRPDDYSTPYRVSLAYQTPKKQSTPSPIKEFSPRSTPHQHNPESKKQNRSHFKRGSPMCEERQDDDVAEVSMFQLSRLEQDYTLIRKLGSGNFSEVGLYQSRMTGELVAIKETRANQMSINEVQALGSLWAVAGESPHVVRYYHSWVEEGDLFLVMEQCSDSVQRMVQRQRDECRHLPEKVIKNLLKASLEGLKSLHRFGIIHLDIKPDNLLLKEGVLKIADFGLSRASKLRSGQVEEGDSRYLAKEVLNYASGVDLTKSDIFSLAMTFYELLTLQRLPNNGQGWLEIRESGLNLTQRMSEYSQRLMEIIDWMGRKEWRLRPSAVELLQDPYFKESPRLHGFLGSRSHKKEREASL